MIRFLESKMIRDETVRGRFRDIRFSLERGDRDNAITQPRSDLLINELGIRVPRPRFERPLRGHEVEKQQRAAVKTGSADGETAINNGTSRSARLLT